MESNNIKMSTVTIDNYQGWASCYLTGTQKLYIFGYDNRVRVYSSDNSYVSYDITGASTNAVQAVYYAPWNSILYSHNNNAIAAFNLTTNTININYTQSTFGFTVSACSMATDGTYLYVAISGNRGQIDKYNSSGTPVTSSWVPANSAISYSPKYMIYDGTYIYRSDGSQIGRIAVATGAYVSNWITFSNANYTGAPVDPTIAIDSNYLYIGLNNALTTNSGQISQYNKSTGVLVNLIVFNFPTSTSGSVSLLMSDGTYLYVQQGGNNALLKLTPPVLTTGNVNPNITSVISQANTLLVSFTGSSNDAFPTPFYYYAVNGSTFANTGLQNANSNIVIKDLPVANAYTIQLSAVNKAGNLLSSNFTYNLTNGIGLQAAYMNQFLFFQRALTTQELTIIRSVPNLISFSSNASVQGISPTITQVYSNANSLTVSYVGVQNAYPPPFYYYTVSSAGTGTLTANSGTNALSGNINITNLTVSGNYSIQLTAVNPAGNVASANAYGQPYTVGSSPNIISVANLANSLSVSFQGVTNWYPDPNYYYSITGDILANYVQVNVSGNAFTIPNLTTSGSRSVYVFANNLVGRKYSTVIGTGSPFVLGTIAPNITQVQSGANSLVVSFVAALGANPAPFYYYSVNGSVFSNTGLTGNGTFTIPGLTVANTYSVQLMAVNTAGNVLSNLANGQPFALGTTSPSITNIYSDINSIIVQYSGPTDAYTAPFYYYSLNSGTAANTTLNTTSGNITIPTTVFGNNTVRLIAVNPAGNVVSVSANGQPYLVGTRPNIISVTPQANSLVVSFNLSANSYTNPDYYYSVSGNTNPSSYVLIPSANITLNPNTFVISGLTSNVAAVVSLLAINPAGNVYSATTVSQTPYVVGTNAPNITQVQSNANSLVVSFTGTFGANPAPFYYYSVAGSVFSNTGLNGNGAFTIPGLTVANTYSVQLMAVNAAGNVLSNLANGQPYVLGTTVPNITQVQSNINSLIVSFTGPQDAYTAPFYYYSVNGSAVFSNTGLNGNGTFTIPGLTVANTYSVQLMAVNPAGNILSTLANGNPYVLGTASPSITNVYPSVNSLTIQYSGVSDANPPPYYYYTISSPGTGTITANSGSNATSGNITISDLTVADNYTIQLTAVNLAGNVVSASATGQPYILGTNVPNITQIQSNANSLVVSFTGVQNANPVPFYYYSVNGSVFSNTGLNDNGTFTIPGLTVANTYTVQLMAVNSAGNVLSATANGQPYVLGTTLPNITQVQSNANSLIVSFTGVQNAYTTPFYYYSVNGSAVFSNTGLNGNGTFTIPGLTVANTYSVRLMAVNPAGNVLSTLANGQPYVLGTTLPNITQVQSDVNSLVVSFTGVQNAYTTPFYYYSVNGSVFSNTGFNSNATFTISGLNFANTYTVQLMAVNPAGNVLSAIENGQPYADGIGLQNAYMNQFLFFQRALTAQELTIIKNSPDLFSFTSNASAQGVSPTITQIYSSANSLIVSYIGVQNAYPAPFYYYTVSSAETGTTTANSGTNALSGNITITNLTVSGNYSVQLIAVNPAGNVSSTTAYGQPYTLGTNVPNITQVQSNANSLVVSFTGVQNAYTQPFYYYSVAGSVFSNTGLNGNGTFTIPGLTVANTYSVRLMAVNPAGNVLSNLANGQPYVLGITLPNITQVQSNANSLIVSFTGVQNAYTSPFYYYSVNGSAVFSNTGLNGNGTFTVPGLTVANTYTVQLMAVNPAGNVLSNLANGQPYVLGTVLPNITQVQSNANSLIVSFTGVQNAYTTPFYYYSVNGSAVFSNTGLNGNGTFTVPGLTVANTYTVQLMAVNQAGNVLSNLANGQPYVLGTVLPNITRVQSNANSLVLSFAGAVGAFPQPFYYYSVDGSAFANTGLNANTTFVIPNLTVIGNYRVQLLASNPAGNLFSGNAYGLPYVVGNVNPNITNVQSNINSLIVSFTGSQNAYPAPYYYYSVAGSTFANTGLNGNGNIVIPGLTTFGNYSVQILAVNSAGNILSGTSYGQPYVIGSTSVCNVNNANLFMNYQFNKDLLDYATGTGVSPYNVSGTVSYVAGTGANTILGNGSAFFGNTNLAGFQPVQNITVGTNGATAATWIKLTSLVPTLQKYTRIFEFVNSVSGLPFFSLQFDASFANVVLAFESGAVFSYPFIVDMNWHHYSVIISPSGNFTLYIDNVARLQNTYGNYSATFTNQINSCYVGGTNTGLTYSI